MNKVKTPQWEAQTTNLWKQDCINITSNNRYTFFPWYWDSKIKNLSTPIFVLSCLVSFFPCPFFLTSLLSHRSFPSLIPQASLPLAFWDIFLSPIGFPFVLILKQDFWEVFVLFRLSYTYLTWQRLGEEPLINAKVAISIILIHSRSFPRYT